MDCSDLLAIPSTTGVAAPYDLITIGQGLHWFDIPAFLTQLKGILREESGVFAVLGYSAFEFDAADGPVQKTLKPIFSAYMKSLIKYFSCDR